MIVVNLKRLKTDDLILEENCVELIIHNHQNLTLELNTSQASKIAEKLREFFELNRGHRDHRVRHARLRN